MKPYASIIIVVKNDPGIAQTLELIEQQKTSVTYETIVVDASSNDALADIRARFPKVIWEQFDQQGKRFTIPEQRNRGLALAKGGVIVSIDANCAPVEGWLEALIQGIKDGEDVVCGPCFASNEHNLVHYIQSHQERTYVDECTTINVALRREVYEQVGGFDNRLEYGEDVDYFWRVRDAGYRLCYEPAAIITHNYGDTEEQIRRAYRYGKARARLHKKHWRTRWSQLLKNEPHVWIYPLCLITLPLAFIWPYYLLVWLIPLFKNRSISLVAHHIVYGVGVLVGVTKPLKHSLES